jgi:hypothetical protein
MSDTPADARMLDALIERTVGGVCDASPEMLAAARAHGYVDSAMTRSLVEVALADFPAAVRNLAVWPELVRTVADRLLEDPEARVRLEALHRAAREGVA